ncbi:MAG: addiction module protein [Candidatus Sumerlaeota bacterium]|nr:addiction module protein [Candidatus Sumerlaeota bacterium]
MTAACQHILSQALQLPPLDRAELIEEIISSFDAQSRKEIDALWAKEAEDRIDAYDHGQMKAIPMEGIFAKIIQR